MYAARALALAALLALLAAVACSSDPTPENRPQAQAKQRKPIDRTATVEQTVQLPGEDGRVHILVVPGDLDRARCVLHVGPSGSSMACPPAAELYLPSAADPR